MCCYIGFGLDMNILGSVKSGGAAWTHAVCTKYLYGLFF